MFSNKLYDTLRWVAIIVLPALSTLIAAIFRLWQLPYGTEIAQTVTAIATFLGAILMISNATYKAKNADTEHHIQSGNWSISTSHIDSQLDSSKEDSEDA